MSLPGTDWAGGVYKVMMEFPDEYPSKVFNVTFDLISFSLIFFLSLPNANSSLPSSILMFIHLVVSFVSFLMYLLTLLK